MPIVALNMELRSVGHADDPIIIDVAVLRVRGAMADTHFRIMLDDGTEAKVLARGSTRQVFTRPDGGLLYHIPDAVEAGFDAMTAHALGQTP
jgi:acyl-CoA thioesterase FadM